MDLEIAWVKTSILLKKIIHFSDLTYANFSSVDRNSIFWIIKKLIKIIFDNYLDMPLYRVSYIGVCVCACVCMCFFSHLGRDNHKISRLIFLFVNFLNN